MVLKKVSCLAALLILIAFTQTSHAQRIGFQVGIATPVMQSPVQSFIAPPVQPFGMFGVTPPIVPPIITTSFGPTHAQFQHHGGIPVFAGQPAGYYVFPSIVPGLVGNGVTVIVPNGTVITNSTVIVQPPQLQGTYIGPHTAAPANPPVVVPAFNGPVIGMPRQQVIQQYGNPVTTIVTANGETLYFSGGATIFIQNGRVARPN